LVSEPPGEGLPGSGNVPSSSSEDLPGVAPPSSPLGPAPIIQGGLEATNPQPVRDALLSSPPEPAFRPVKVVDLDIELPPGTMSGLERYGSLQVLVRRAGTPLGWVRVPVANGRCTGSDLASAVLEQLSEEVVLAEIEGRLAHGFAPSEERSDPSLSQRDGLPSATVAVCTRDRPESLARCLESIERLRYPSMEVIVVDSCPSSADTESLIRERWPSVRYMREPRPGLDWARNRAVSEARGDVIAYTDDDVVVDEGWLEAIGGVFTEDDGVSAVTGLVVPLELETRAQVLFELYGGFGRGFKRVWHRAGPTSTQHLGAGRFGTGANMAFRRTLLERLGGFDPALDVGTVTNGGGDIEMFFRILQEGYLLVYEPAAIVRHRHRSDYEALHTQMTNHGVGFFSYAVRSVLAYPDQLLGFARYTAWWLRSWILRRLMGCIVRPGRFPADLVLAELKGGLIGLTRYSRARRHALELSSHTPVPDRELVPRTPENEAR
jgi:O-antigen biosynthesis protein